MNEVSPPHPPAPPVASSPASVAEVENTPLGTLIHHREYVQCDTRMEDVHRFFSERQIDFVALVRDGQVRGICGRAQLAFQLGSRFGFALNARSPAHLASVKQPLVFEDRTPLREVLQVALGRHDDEFYEDVALVDRDLQLVGSDSGGSADPPAKPVGQRPAGGNAPPECRVVRGRPRLAPGPGAERRPVCERCRGRRPARAFPGGCRRRTGASPSSCIWGRRARGFCL
ncbi:MAG: hypothetical protein WDM96_16365 [Lacunisphaera sp.]